MRSAPAESAAARTRVSNTTRLTVYSAHRVPSGRTPGGQVRNSPPVRGGLWVLPQHVPPHLSTRFRESAPSGISSTCTADIAAYRRQNEHPYPSPSQTSGARSRRVTAARSASPAYRARDRQRLRMVRVPGGDMALRPNPRPAGSRCVRVNSNLAIHPSCTSWVNNDKVHPGVTPPPDSPGAPAEKLHQILPPSRYRMSSV